jgi:hypothetical protein
MDFAVAGQHPADTDGDWRFGIGELTKYGAAWRLGSAWATGPTPIPVAYVTRAADLWRSGETYRRDDTQPCPLCWLPLASAPLPLAEPWLPLTAVPVVAFGPWADEQALSPDAGHHDGLTGPVWPDGRTFDATIAGAATRDVAATYAPAVPLTVSIAVTPASDTRAWAVEEVVPAGWRVDGVSADGYWDEPAHVVRWGPIFNPAAQTLHYRLTPSDRAAGQQNLRGTASFDGSDVPVGGCRTISPVSRVRRHEPSS